MEQNKAIKVVVDSSSPNYKDVKDILEKNGIEVVPQDGTIDFDEEIFRQMEKLQSFEVVNIVSDSRINAQLAGSESEIEPAYQKHNTRKARF